MLRAVMLFESLRIAGARGPSFIWGHPVRRIAVVTATLLGVLATAPGCSTQCDRHPDQPPTVFRGGTTHDDWYESSPVSGPFLDFAPGRTYRFVHGLGGPPQNLECYFSFNPYPLDGGVNSSGFVPCGTNQSTFQDDNATYFDLRNDTCSEVFLRVFASDPWPLHDAGASSSTPATPDAGTSKDSGVRDGGP
jgi:hypothetical protein